MSINNPWPPSGTPKSIALSGAPHKASLAVWSLVLSVFTLAAFHVPFFRHMLSCLDGGPNAVLLVGGAILLLLALDYLLYYLLAFLLRLVGKCIIAFTLFGDAVMLYFVRNYEVLVTDDMMGNFFRTQYSEASGFMSISFVLYILLLCVLPCIYVFGRKVDYGSWKKFFASIGISLVLVAGVAFGNMKNWPWIDRNATELGSLLMPWSYTVNSFRYWSAEKKRNAREIPLADPTAVSSSRDVCVLVIGESARRDHFSLYGYGRETNPYTAQDGVTAYVAESSATFTAAGVKAILEPMDTPQLYEILPNYLHRIGADVSWRTSNWGEPPVHIDKYYTIGQLAERYPGENPDYDGLLLAGLAEEIRASDKDKVFVFLHTNTNHGPAYNTKYPPQFEVFTPVCATVEMAKTSQEELFNAYDNSLIYTDYLLHMVIGMLRDMPERRSCLIYVSDHGESLGENNLYMHGVPMSMAPKEQIEIPFLVWTSDSALKLKKLPAVGQHHVFHSVLRFLGVETPAFDASKSIFE